MASRQAYMKAADQWHWGRELKEGNNQQLTSRASNFVPRGMDQIF
jgi:hypothetical protein